MELAGRYEYVLMENPKTFIARVKSALQKSKITISCNFWTVRRRDLCLIFLEKVENFQKDGGDTSPLSWWFRRPWEALSFIPLVLYCRVSYSLPIIHTLRRWGKGGKHFQFYCFLKSNLWNHLLDLKSDQKYSNSCRSIIANQY